MQINRATLQSAYVGFSAAFASGLAMSTSQAAMVATTVTSTTGTQEYGWLSKMPRIREWIGDRHINALETDGYKIKNKDFELTVEVDRNDFEDDNLGMYTPLFQDLGAQATTFPDELVFSLLKAGFETKCFDGQYFFDTDHPVLDKDGNDTSVSNMQAGSSAPWFLLDTSRPLKPIIFQERKSFGNLVRMDKDNDANVFMRKSFMYGLDGRANVGFGFWQTAFGSKAALDAANYEAARAAMMSFKADHGKPLAIMPKLLCVPPELEGAARKLVENQLASNGETNQWYGTAEVMVCPWLA